MIVEDAQPRRRRGGLILLVRFLLHWLIMILVLAFLGVRSVFRRRLVRYGLLAVLVVGVVAWNVLAPLVQSLYVPSSAATARGVAPSEIVSTVAASQLPQPLVIERYLKAQANFDANGMWENMSDRLKRRMTSNNSSVQQIQAQLDTARQQGRSYAGATYVGGVPMEGEQSVYFYVITTEGPGGTAQIPYVYLIGQDGKIASIW